MDGISYKKSITKLSDFVLTNASLSDDILSISNNGTALAEYSGDLFSSASKYFRLYVEFSGITIDSNYSSNIKIDILVKYKVNDTEQCELISCSFNNWVYEDNKYYDDTYINTLGYEITGLKVKVSNSVGETLKIYKLEISQSFDVETVTTAESVAYFTAISADVARINSLYVNDIVTETLETNMEPLFPHNAFPSNGIRQYFKIYENEQEYREDTLSDSELVPYTIGGTQMYYNLIQFDIVVGTDEITNVVLDLDAYSKVDPIERIEDSALYSESLKENIRNAAKIMVRKAVSSIVKKRDTDGLVLVSGDTYYNTPVTILGAGNGVEYTGPSFGLTLSTGVFYNGQVVEWKDDFGKHSVYLNDNNYTEQVNNQFGIDLGGGNISIPVTDTVIFHDVSDTIELRCGENVTIWEHSSDTSWDYLTSQSNPNQIVKFKSVQD